MNKLRELIANATGGKWEIVNTADAGKGWTVFFFGTSQIDNNDCAIEAMGIPAEYIGDAKDDATLVVWLRNHATEIADLIEACEKERPRMEAELQEGILTTFEADILDALKALQEKEKE